MTKTLSNQTYEKQGEWSGYEINQTEKGYMVTFWSRIQGNTDGDKYLYRFDDEFKPGIDLSIKWNDAMTYGDYLANTIRTQYRSAKEFGQKSNIKRLVKGEAVK